MSLISMSSWNAEIFVQNSHHNCQHAADVYGDFTMMLDDRISYFGTEVINRSYRQFF